ncbi:MAG: ankyrin repeat domain-containing protein, partial [Candidatus Angelobacter sp.]
MKAATALIVAFATALFAQQQPTPPAHNVQRMNTFGVAPVFAAISATTANFAQEGEKGTLRWSFETRGEIESPAIAADGTIYVASSDKNLYALSPEGKQKWVFKTGGPVDSSPAIAADGTIYVWSDDGNLYAITPEGKRKWAFTGGYSSSTPALAADGTIYATNRDMKLYALTPAGRLKWSVEMECGVFAQASSSPALGADGTIYVGGCDNKLHAFTPEGKSQWAFAVAGDPMMSSPALGADGTIYVANNDSQRDVFTLYAFTPQGKVKWSFESQSGWSKHPLPPVIALDGTIYYVAVHLFALTPEGKRKWSFSEWAGNSPAAIGADGTIYGASWKDELYAITPDGTLKWSLHTGSEIRSSPVIGADGTIYAGTSVAALHQKNMLFAFRVSSRGYAAGPWSSDQARWMKHGGGQPAVEQAPAPTVAELRRSAAPAPSSENGPRQVEAVAELEKRGIPFAPERFLECAEVGDSACVKLFLQAGMKAQDEAGGAALLRAVGQGHLEVAEILLENGANPDARRWGATALSSASSSGRLDIVQLLLAKGANPNPRGEHVDTPLSAAARAGRVEVARVLLEKGADPNQEGFSGTALRDAAERGQLEVLKLLLEKGADPNLRSAELWWTATALLAASHEGHVEVVKALVAKGANLELGDRGGRTALMVASNGGHVEIVRILLESGANVKARDDQGK